MFSAASLSDLPAFCIGHAHDQDAGTGCTVVIAPDGATCGVDVRGGGPATRETDLLKPENMIEAVHAVVLSGGSAFGLEASCGVMDALAQRGIGFPLGEAHVPIVVGACLFDLLVGKPTHPDKTMGQLACERAFARRTHISTEKATREEGEKDAAQPTIDSTLTPAVDSAPNSTTEPLPELAQGNVGAGCGATLGKLARPEQAMKSGFGWTCLRAGEVVVGALVAVNALGCVRDEQGTWIAGVRDDEDRVMDPLSALALGFGAANAAVEESKTDQTANRPCTNTTIGVILTNAHLSKAQATKVSSTAHDAYARTIKPVHTSNDGDTIFTFASGEVEAQTDLVAIAATEAMQQAILSAVRHAKSAFGLPAASDLA